MKASARYRTDISFSPIMPRIEYLAASSVECENLETIPAILFPVAPPRILAIIFICGAFEFALAQGSANTAVEIDLQEQTAHLVRDGRVVLSTPISTGRQGYFTKAGSFKIVEKERNHYSNMYGRIVNARGNTIVSDADADMRVPRGGRFIPSPMRYFMRFDGATGMHAGYLPGYAASHGCIRLPERNAIAFFNAVDVGTPVTVFGTTERGRSGSEYTMQRRRRQLNRPRIEPRFDEWPGSPFWRR